MAKKHLRTVTIDFFLPEEDVNSYDDKLVEHLTEAFNTKYPTCDYLIKSSNKKEIDTYFIAGEGSEWEALYEDRKTTKIFTTMTFPKGGFCLTDAIEKIKLEYRCMNFTPTNISKL